MSVLEMIMFLNCNGLPQKRLYFKRRVSHNIKQNLSILHCASFSGLRSHGGCGWTGALMLSGARRDPTAASTRLLAPIGVLWCFGLAQSLVWRRSFGVEVKGMRAGEDECSSVRTCCAIQIGSGTPEASAPERRGPPSPSLSVNSRSQWPVHCYFWPFADSFQCCRTNWGKVKMSNFIRRGGIYLQPQTRVTPPEPWTEAGVRAGSETSATGSQRSRRVDDSVINSLLMMHSCVLGAANTAAALHPLMKDNRFCRCWTFISCLYLSQTQPAGKRHLVKDVEMWLWMMLHHFRSRWCCKGLKPLGVLVLRGFATKKRCCDRSCCLLIVCEPSNGLSCFLFVSFLLMHQYESEAKIEFNRIVLSDSRPPGSQSFSPPCWLEVIRRAQFVIG